MDTGPTNIGPPDTSPTAASRADTRTSAAEPAVDATAPRLTPAARRILEVAGELFYRSGIAAVGVDTIAAESGVTKRTLYDRFGSKDALVATYLSERDRLWRLRIARATEAAGPDPRRRAMVPFDVLPGWLVDSERGCRLVNAFVELPDPAHPAHELVLAEKVWLRELFRAEVAALGVPDPDGMSVALFALHEGALVAHAMAGVADAATPVSAAAEALLDAAVPPGR